MEEEVLPPDFVKLLSIKKDLISRDISEFKHHSLTKVKFILMILFRLAHGRYIMQEKEQFKKEGKDQPMSSSFSYSYFTPPGSRGLPM